MKRPRRIQLPSSTVGTSRPGDHRDSEDEAGPGGGYEGDSSSGSGRSWGERSRRPRAGHRSRASSRGRRSPGGGSEANGLALVSGFKRLPRQDVQMRPLKSVLVRRRESDGEPGWGLHHLRGCSHAWPGFPLSPKFRGIGTQGPTLSTFRSETMPFPVSHCSQI